MESSSKLLWIVTIANVVTTFLLVFVLFAIWVALGVLAAEISLWPLLILLPLGLALSVIGLKATKGVVPYTSRRITYLVNGCALAFNLVIVFGLAAVFFGSTRERFLIPDGYRGDVYIVYGASDGELLEKTRWAVTYQIPKEGVLRVQGPMTRNWTSPEYYLQTETGKVERIRNIWSTTIHPTPENLTNDKDIGVFFPRTGSFTDSTGCSVEFQRFYVGTKAYLLTKYKESDISAYLRNRPVQCLSRPR